MAGLTRNCYRFTAAIQGEVSALREREDQRTTRLVSPPSFQSGPSNRLSFFRLEEAIASLKPVGTKTNPTTNFWTVYKKVADEHDNDLVSKYVGDLDTSLLFVSPSMSCAHPIPLNRVILLH